MKLRMADMTRTLPKVPKIQARSNMAKYGTITPTLSPRVEF